MWYELINKPAIEMTKKLISHYGDYEAYDQVERELGHFLNVESQIIINDITDHILFTPGLI